MCVNHEKCRKISGGTLQTLPGGTLRHERTWVVLHVFLFYRYFYILVDIQHTQQCPGTTRILLYSDRVTHEPVPVTYYEHRCSGIPGTWYVVCRTRRTSYEYSRTYEYEANPVCIIPGPPGTAVPRTGTYHVTITYHTRYIHDTYTTSIRGTYIYVVRYHNHIIRTNYERRPLESKQCVGAGVHLCHVPISHNLSIAARSDVSNSTPAM